MRALAFFLITMLGLGGCSAVLRADAEEPLELPVNAWRVLPGPPRGDAVRVNGFTEPGSAARIAVSDLAPISGTASFVVPDTAVFLLSRVGELPIAPGDAETAWFQTGQFDTRRAEVLEARAVFRSPARDAGPGVTPARPLAGSVRPLATNTPFGIGLVASEAPEVPTGAGLLVGPTTIASVTVRTDDQPCSALRIGNWFRTVLSRDRALWSGRDSAIVSAPAGQPLDFGVVAVRNVLTVTLSGERLVDLGPAGAFDTYPEGWQTACLDAAPGRGSVGITASWRDRNRLLKDDWWAGEQGLLHLSVGNRHAMSSYSPARGETLALSDFEALPFTDQATWLDDLRIEIGERR